MDRNVAVASRFQCLLIKIAICTCSFIFHVHCGVSHNSIGLDGKLLYNVPSDFECWPAIIRLD